MAGSASLHILANYNLPLNRALGIQVIGTMNPGDWVDGLNGIGKLISLHPVHADELDNLIRNDQLTSKLRDIAIYKVLCDFDGNIKKRISFAHGNTSICTPISKESKKIIESITSSQPEVISTFDSKTTNKEFGEWLDVRIQYEEKLFSNLEAVSQTIKIFTFLEFIEKIKSSGISVLDFQQVDVSRPHITLSFFNKNYESISKRRLYSKVSCILSAQYA